MLDFSKLKASTNIDFGKATRRRSVPKVNIGAEKDKKEIEVPGLINGRTAGSILEWRAAQALWRLGWTFLYQVPLRGGTQMRGGYVLDFLIKTAPLWTAMPVNGRYWHNKITEEYELTEMMDALKEAGYQVNNEPLMLWEENASSVDAAEAFIYQHIGRG